MRTGDFAFCVCKSLIILFKLDNSLYWVDIDVLLSVNVCKILLCFASSVCLSSTNRRFLVFDLNAIFNIKLYENYIILKF